MLINCLQTTQSLSVSIFKDQETYNLIIFTHKTVIKLGSDINLIKALGH